MSFYLLVDPINAIRIVLKEGRLECVIDLKNRTCERLVFQTGEISCIHTILAIDSRNMIMSRYFFHWFTKEALVKIYQGKILPIESTISRITTDCIEDQITKPLM